MVCHSCNNKTDLYKVHMKKTSSVQIYCPFFVVSSLTFTHQSVPISCLLRSNRVPPLFIPLLPINCSYLKVVLHSPLLLVILMLSPRLYTEAYCFTIIFLLSLPLNHSKYMFFSVTNVGLLDSFLNLKPASPSNCRVELVNRSLGNITMIMEIPRIYSTS
jgi:hypothetical protein